MGIDSENLLVLEVISDAMSRDILENMLVKFNLFLVEETDIIDPANPNKSNLLFNLKIRQRLIYLIKKENYGKMMILMMLF